VPNGLPRQVPNCSAASVEVSCTVLTSVACCMINKNSAVTEIDDDTRAKWAEKWGVAVPLFVGGGLGSYLTVSPVQCHLYQVVS